MAMGYNGKYLQCNPVASMGWNDWKLKLVMLAPKTDNYMVYYFIFYI
jgi:hypothetical protein